MTKIKFGTDGWRAIIAKDFTVENVARVTEATSKWLKNNFENPIKKKKKYFIELFQLNKKKFKIEKN